MRTGLSGCCAILLTVVLGSAAPAKAQPAVTLPDAASADWTLSGGAGERISLPDGPAPHAFRVTGDGADTNHWFCNVPLEPGRLYRVRFQYRRSPDAVGGVAVAGPALVNRDFRGSADWQTGCYVFATPPQVSDRTFRLGQWQVKGSVEFAGAVLGAVEPAHRLVDGIALGAGEEIDECVYRFDAPLAAEESNYSRPLAGFTARFNANRWVFSDGAYVVYRHRLPGAKIRSMQVEVAVNHHTRGRCIVEASTDGDSWTELAAADKVATLHAGLPEKLLPDEEVFVRLRAADGGTFQVNAYRCSAELDGMPRHIRGATYYLDVSASDPEVEVRIDGFGLVRPGLENPIQVSVTNRSSRQRSFTVSSHTGPADQPPDPSTRKQASAIETAAGAAASVRVPLVVSTIGDRSGRLEVRDESDRPVFTGTWRFHVPALYDAGYGEALPAPGQGVKLWWCDATRKVSRDRPVPTQMGRTISLEAARNEFEAAQLVIRPERALCGLAVSAGDLRGPGNATITKDHIELLCVGYVRVRVPTDALGVADDWPDPLPPIKGPIDVPAGANQPIWVLVRVPKDAAAGDYEGTVTLSAEGWSAPVPIRMHVWNFTLPAAPHTQSAFGLSMGTVYQYQGIRDEADQRKVFAKYMQSFADHRISPYDPTPFDPIRIKFVSDTDPPRAEVDFQGFDSAMQQAVDRWHVTSFNLRLPGMGGGTFHSRHEGQIEGFAPGSPQYEAMFSSVVERIETHLREKGWLDKAYVYWFDEPEPRDYDFVRAGMGRIKRYAPAIRRMLTEEPVEPLFESVDLWCPVSHNYSHEAAEERRGKGEQFWWYVCTGPKAPYCTLFIDHPATDLRVWLWQTWQRKIDGILVWTSTYWTSGAAFPDSLQNPYEDPMAYVSGYSTPKGTKAYWGNGDGRFVYPPEAAAAGSAKPVLDGPVSSIRWEMLRDGIEDVDYLHLAQAAIESNTAGADTQALAAAKALLEVPADITSSMTAYSFDSEPIYARRRAVARAIERLTLPAAAGARP